MVRSAVCVFLIAGLAAAAPARAQAVLKCQKKGSTPIFTTDGCPSGYAVAKAVFYTPDPHAKPYRPNVRERPYAPLGGVAQGSTITVQRNESACEAARRWRDVVLGSNNQGGNVDVRRQLNDAVAREC